MNLTGIIPFKAEYRGSYIKADQCVGQWSDVVKKNTLKLFLVRFMRPIPSRFPKIRPTTRHFLLHMLLVQWLFALCLTAQSLPEGWWQQGSAENILEKAKSITHDLSYFQGSKAHLLNESDASIEFFQRSNPDGIIETKYVYYEGNTTVTEYKIKSGRYLLEMGRLVKAEFEDHQKELSLAATIGRPYDYKILQPEIVGTNDCLVIARIATPEFQHMLKAALYPGYTPKPGSLFADPTNYIISEIDTYIRKSDGVIIGEVKKNNLGGVREDRLYDVVQINNRIPDAEFVLPNAPVETATNINQLSHIIFNGKHASNSPSSRESKWIRFVIIGIMAISLGVLLYIIIRFYRRGTTN